MSARPTLKQNRIYAPDPDLGGDFKYGYRTFLVHVHDRFELPPVEMARTVRWPMYVPTGTENSSMVTVTTDFGGGSCYTVACEYAYVRDGCLTYAAQGRRDVVHHIPLHNLAGFTIETETVVKGLRRRQARRDLVDVAADRTGTV